MPEKQDTTRKNNKIWTKGFISFLLLLVVLVFLSLGVGAYDFLNHAQGWKMFFITRVPRTLALMLAGAGMAIPGLIMQLISQNKFVDPTTTGTIEWAGLGLLVVYLLVPDPSLIERMTGAIIFAFVGTIIFFVFLENMTLTSKAMVPITGIVIGAVVSAVSTFMGMAFQMTQSLETWFNGSFANIELGNYEYLWIVVIVTLAIYFYADHLTVIGLGKNMSTNLGVNYKQVMLISTVLISLNVGVISAVVGKLPFIGLIVPNIVSMVRGDNVRTNLLWVALLGMVVILACDILSRVLIYPFELPVSLILGIIGTLVFAFLILYQRRRV